MEEFSEFIEDMELQDLPLVGGRFTWRKGDGYDIAARLDRFMIFEEWEVAFKIKQSILPRVTSDHNPLMLECGNWERSTSNFKFENWWLQTQDFKERVKEWWNSATYVGKPDYILACKLRLLKVKLKEWSKAIHENLGMQKQSILNQLAELDLMQDQRILSDDESYLRVVLTVEFEENAKREEVAWRQRSRALWLKEEDMNTKFFHRTANCHKRYNNIDKLIINGSNVTEPAEIRDEVTTFYQKLYTETKFWRPQFNPRGQSRIDEEDNAALQAQFEEQDIKNCVFSCVGDKALGPDGFTMAFFKQCWEEIKQEVVAAIQNFHDQGYFEKSFNATFIALIPKKFGASKLKDFRPISLIGSNYKIISKILTERLKKVMPKLVDEQQMAFIKGRQIMYAILVANECVDMRYISKVPRILCKLDIEKAYDHLNWEHMWRTLRRMGFRNTWIKWMRFC
ncbi:hypothetical protein MTR67_026391 [Solanum verrucosum]|uniref:Reverse transcriptase domain-containing protein n=1 Tax=Solanum verrucosum TaxID=315347 RepID=A0AAF0TUE9_SOLVR|nr:hypothetical protein MTR67_026391 [Solanum verrucosum]